ncbi:MAG: prepilin-type N-terminal cleavage/methylation domain-containing protein [Patescibacteria group bacterium]|jgi:prepilin-type N-terminal cleavage/methylation domain-containing protein
MNKQIIKNENGFTLIEMLVSMAVFSLMVFAVGAIYIAFNSSQVRTTASQQVLNDSQYAMDFMAKEIRNNAIVKYSLNCDDFINTVGANADVFSKCIILKRPNGQVFAFTSHNNGADAKVNLLYVLLTCTDNTCNTYEDIYFNSGSVATLLGPDLNNIQLDNLDFLINPTTDPFVINGPNAQPKVTINMKVVYNSTNQTKRVNYVFQTTVSSRIYKR